MKTYLNFDIEVQVQYSDTLKQLERIKIDKRNTTRVDIGFKNVTIDVAELFRVLPSTFQLNMYEKCVYTGERAYLSWTDSNKRSVHVTCENKKDDNIKSLLSRLPESDNYDLHVVYSSGSTMSSDVFDIVPSSCRLITHIGNDFDVSLARNVKATTLDLLVRRDVSFSNPPYQFPNLKFMEIRATQADETLFNFVSTLVCDDTLVLWLYFSKNGWGDLYDDNYDEWSIRFRDAYWRSSLNLIVDADEPTLFKDQMRLITMKKKVLTLYHGSKNPTSSLVKFLNLDGDDAIMRRVVRMLINKLPVRDNPTKRPYGYPDYSRPSHSRWRYRYA